MSSQPSSTRVRQIVWPSVVTVISAAILIGAEVFGAAFAGGWALAILLGLDDTGAHILQAVLFAIGVFIMAAFIRAAQRVEPFTRRVSVGRYPDKRPDSRQGTKNRGSLKSNLGWSVQHLSQEMPLKVSSLLATVTGSRRRTGAPRSQRGTRLKATTDRAFLVSAGFPPAGANTEEACPSLPGVRAGSFPTNPRQHNSV